MEIRGIFSFYKIKKLRKETGESVFVTPESLPYSFNQSINFKKLR